MFRLLKFVELSISLAVKVVTIIVTHTRDMVITSPIYRTRSFKATMPMRAIPQFGAFFFLSFFLLLTNYYRISSTQQKWVQWQQRQQQTTVSPFCSRYFQVTPTPTNDVPKRGQTSMTIRWVRLDSREGWQMSWSMCVDIDPLLLLWNITNSRFGQCNFFLQLSIMGWISSICFYQHKLRVLCHLVWGQETNRAIWAMLLPRKVHTSRPPLFPRKPWPNLK